MKNISVANDIIPIGEFKTRIAKWFRNVQNTGQPLIITQKGKPAAILLSPSEYDSLIYKKCFFESVARGISDADSERRAAAEVVFYLLSQIAGKNQDIGQTTRPEQFEQVLKKGLPTDTDHRFWNGVGQRFEACPFATRENNGLHSFTRSLLPFPRRTFAR